MSKQAIQTDSAPAAIGPYSQAVVSNGLLFTSGQLPIDPATGKIPDGSIEDNIRYGSRDVDTQALTDAARLAQAHDFVSALPEGYATRVGVGVEGGSVLWGRRLGNLQGVHPVQRRFMPQLPPPHLQEPQRDRHDPF